MNFYFFSHFIQTWILPPGCNLLLIFLALILLRFHAFLAIILLMISFISLWVLSLPVISIKLINKLQHRYAPLKIQEGITPTTASAIVVLGGGDSEEPEYENKRFVSDLTLSRLHYATYLYQKTHIPIIVSGGALEDPLLPEGNNMGYLLREHFNVPVLLEENNSINTMDEARLLVPLLIQKKIQHVYLITHAWHMPRSMYAFKQAFKETKLQIIAAPMGYIKYSDDQRFLNYLPSLAALEVSTIALHECIGMFWYKMTIPLGTEGIGF